MNKDSKNESGAWPAEYFAAFTPAEIDEHVRAMASLGPDRPVVLLTQGLRSGRLGVTVLAHDRLGVFGIIAGVLGVQGGNIEQGVSFTSRPDPLPSRTTERGLLRRGWESVSPAGRRRIVDRFVVRLREPRDIEEWTAETRKYLETVFRVLADGGEVGLRRARRLVNERVAAAIGRGSAAAQRALFPVTLEVDNSGDDTEFFIESQDTPFFLYSLATALSLRGISLEAVVIDTREGVVHDRMRVLERNGGKIVDPERLDEIRFRVLLTKHFTFFLNAAPDPFVALERFQRVAEILFKSSRRGAWRKRLENPRTLIDLARFLGASDSLWEDFIRAQHENLLPLIELSHSDAMMDFSGDALRARLRRALAGTDDRDAFRKAFNRWKDHELFLMDLRQILHPSGDPRELAEPMTRLAEIVVGEAFDYAFARMQRRFGVPRTVGGLETAWSVFGLGKFGGMALGYASDIELLFVYGDAGETDGAERIDNAEFFERLVECATGLILARREGVFEIDLRLRPFGVDGPLAAGLESFCRYFGPGGAAREYEFLALTRLRWVAGDEALGRRVERLRDAFVYTRRTPRLDDLRKLRERQYRQMGAARSPNAKFSAGALVDLEYCVQGLQVLHARNHPNLRTPRIHEALAALEEAGVIAGDDRKRLTAAYSFLRRLINGLRMLRGNARDLLLPRPGTLEYQHLARRMGYRRRKGLDAGRHLYLDFSTWTASVRDFMGRYFGDNWVPDADQGNVADLLLNDAPSEALRDRVLGEMGFHDPAKAWRNLRSLAGAGRRRDLFLRLAVLAGDMLRASPDPDMALNNWERIVKERPGDEFHFAQLLLQPRRLEILLTVCAASQFLADTLVRNPDFFEAATNPMGLKTVQDRASMLDRLDRFCAPAKTDAEWLDFLRRFRRREILRIGTLDLCLGTSLSRVTAELSALAEAVIERWTRRAYEGLKRLAPPPVGPGGFAVLALGKLGGGELNYSSDVDLLGVCAEDDGSASADAVRRFRARWMARILQGLGKHTGEGCAYRVDLRLRPYGASGPLVTGETALIAYFRTAAAPWERQALLKIRAIAGDMELGERTAARLRGLLSEREDVAETIAEMRRMRRKTINRTAQGGIDVKSGRGGIRDIEFVTQALQLRHLRAFPELNIGHTIQALERLHECGVLEDGAYTALRKSYEFLRRVEHLLQVLQDRQTHTLPVEPAARKALARRLLGDRGDERALLARIEEARAVSYALFDALSAARA